MLPTQWHKSLIRSSVFFHDLAMITLAWGLAHWLRFNLEPIPPENLHAMLTTWPIVIIIQGSLFWYVGLYRGLWRFASIMDLERIVKSTLIGMGVILGMLFVWNRIENLPRSVFPLFTLLLIGGTSGSRILYRWLKDKRYSWQASPRVLIVGAGQAGEMLVRELHRDHQRLYQPLLFLDDNPAKTGTEIHGIPVVGRVAQLPQLVESRQIDLVLIAIPTAPAKQMRRIVELCEQAHVPFRTLPGMQNLISGRVTLNELREVSIEDLLGREQVQIDWDSIHHNLDKATVMITGGGGSIGSELCVQIANQAPGHLVVVDQSEFNLYEIEQKLRRTHPQLAMTFLLGDVAEKKWVDNLLATWRPKTLYHAAAYKHVPMLEHQLRQAVQNNILATCRLAEAADRHQCDEFVLISSDKAVNPANIMGASKRVAEIFCQNLASRSKTRFVTVRFGNVLGSSGSVVPLFREQIRNGGPVTVTHPEITRYFMTIPEACQLIIQAALLGQGGEIFVLDMGEPIKISYLAEQMITLSGKTPGQDIEIVYTGLRPGEKLFEELFHEQEPLRPTPHPKILLANPRIVDWNTLQKTMIGFENACDTFNEETLHQHLVALVPEHRMTSPPSINAMPQSPRKTG